MCDLDVTDDPPKVSVIRKVDTYRQGNLVFVVYYKSIKREVKTSPICDCRCDERLKPKDDASTCLTYTGLLEELEYLKDRDEVNRREVWECDG